MLGYFHDMSIPKEVQPCNQMTDEVEQALALSGQLVLQVETRLDPFLDLCPYPLQHTAKFHVLPAVAQVLLLHKFHGD